jgi:hypothetical protein
VLVARELNAQFHHVAIIEDVIFPHRLPVVCGTAPQLSFVSPLMSCAWVPPDV